MSKLDKGRGAVKVRKRQESLLRLWRLELPGPRSREQVAMMQTRMRS